ncbi:hypothetical protein [Carnobacterium divergens]|uniref:Uncharacterized protein n=1 Tax=Carnobacterium divergens TaxID=2748 RepID=A0AAW8R5E3_CARDV|nr:hypothetical protein [Carnobacterium divergens]MDT1957041.1 hypothetical protein [Carnobacterium divergens]MDT1973011.1 hypothetical protein [Carnobacterium divergens]MDT2012681.1 hypothetical protein [Carnobacterium divergens]
MRIDENWDDCFIYIADLEYPSAKFNTQVQTTRTFVLHKEYTKDEFDLLMTETFGANIVVIHFDSWSEGHLLKIKKRGR